MMFRQMRQNGARGRFALARSLSWATHVKNLSRHNSLRPGYVLDWPVNMALLAAESGRMQLLDNLVLSMNFIISDISSIFYICIIAESKNFTDFAIDKSIL